jgi:quercetin dioxygenase-like cupin family protein
MKLARAAAILTAVVALMTICGATVPPADLPQRTELKRADLSETPEMQVISSISEIRTGEEIPLHLHHGIETGYVLQGTLVQYPGKAPTMMPTGAAIMNLRDVPHGGFKVVGPEPLRLFTVHVVDKGKPLYEWVK